MGFSGPEAGRIRDRSGSAGFSALELILVLVVMAIVAAFAIPAVGAMRTAAAVQNGRHGVESALSLARAAAIQYGRPSVLHIDPAGERLWVEVDTTVAGTGTALDTVRVFAIGEELQVDLESDRLALCFDGRGIGTTGTPCPAAGAVITLTRAGKMAIVRVSATGRVLP